MYAVINGPITNSSSNYNTTYKNCFYNDFINSLSEVKDKSMLMNHLPSTINIASKIFGGYLTEEELQEKQFEGRFWDIASDNTLYILVDNDTVAIIVNNTNKKDIQIMKRDNCYSMPDTLRGRYYFDEYRL